MGNAAGEDMEGAVKDMLASALRDQASKSDSSFYDDVMGFYHAVDWTEPWLIGIGCIHLMAAVMAFATRNSLSGQCCIGGSLGCSCLTRRAILCILSLALHIS